MKKYILYLGIAFCGINSMSAQHYKKDGTPDMRYKENRNSYDYSSQSGTNPNTVHVDEYKKKDGTIIEEHNRTAPNSTNHDNWSTSPNVNPETGKKGYKTPD